MDIRASVGEAYGFQDEEGDMWGPYVHFATVGDDVTIADLTPEQVLSAFGWDGLIPHIDATSVDGDGCLIFDVIREIADDSDATYLRLNFYVTLEA